MMTYHYMQCRCLLHLKMSVAVCMKSEDVPVFACVYLIAECVHAADNFGHAVQHCELIEGRHRGADILARCPRRGRHPPSPSAEESGEAKLWDPELQNLHTNKQSTRQT